MNDHEDAAQTSLIHRAKKGDRHAFAMLYETIYQELYRFALYTMRHSQDAEDVVSETVIAAYENIGKLRKTEKFKSWMFTILSNKCKKRLMARERTNVEVQDNDWAMETDLAGNQDLHRAFALLTGEERLILTMMILEGYNSTEAGRILKMNPNTVRSKQSRALEKMRQILE